MCLTHKAVGRCPYCGTAFDVAVPHQTDLVECCACQRDFVARVTYTTTVHRIEGESYRYNSNRRSAAIYQREAA